MKIPCALPLAPVTPAPQRALGNVIGTWRECYRSDTWMRAKASFRGVPFRASLISSRSTFLPFAMLAPTPSGMVKKVPSIRAASHKNGKGISKSKGVRNEFKKTDTLIRSAAEVSYPDPPVRES